MTRTGCLYYACHVDGSWRDKYHNVRVTIHHGLVEVDTEDGEFVVYPVGPLTWKVIPTRDCYLCNMEKDNADY